MCKLSASCQHHAHKCQENLPPSSYYRCIELGPGEQPEKIFAEGFMTDQEYEARQREDKAAVEQLSESRTRQKQATSRGASTLRTEKRGNLHSSMSPGTDSLTVLSRDRLSHRKADDVKASQILLCLVDQLKGDERRVVLSTFGDEGEHGFAKIQAEIDTKAKHLKRSTGKGGKSSKTLANQEAGHQVPPVSCGGSKRNKGGNQSLSNHGSKSRRELAPEQKWSGTDDDEPPPPELEELVFFLVIRRGK